ncbi:MAG: sigma 54-interacting transcriptional regulator, partial [Gemmatimonadaceae bacterium]
PTSMVTKNGVMREAIGRLPELARSTAPVIVHGERGVGKSHFARYLHALSGGVRDSLIEVQQTGGMLTGAAALVGRQGVPSGGPTPTGAFLAADRGTTVIDLNSLDGEARTVLRNAITDNSFTRIGGSQRIQLTTRVILCVDDNADATEFGSATGVERIAIPPLRQRHEDLALLAAELLAEQVGPPRMIVPEAIDVLNSYSWPGNVRELRVVLARCALLAARENISAGDLRLLLATGAVGVEGRGAPLSDLEKLHIEAMLVRFHWHQGRAAEALGISTKTLYRKMREFGFRRPRKRKLARVRPEG